MLEITSSQNPRVKNAVRLREARHRREQGLMLIDGARELSRAIAAGVRMAEVFVCPSLCATAESRTLLGFLRESESVSNAFELLEVSPAVFEKLAFGDRAEGVLGVAELPRMELSEIILPSPPAHNQANEVGPACRAGLLGVNSSASSSVYNHLSPARQAGPTRSAFHPLIVVLEGVEKPGNLGAVLRSADAAGVSALILADSRVDLYNPNAIRASLGTIFSVPVCEATSDEVLVWLREHHLKIFAARVDGSVSYTQVDYRGPSAFVLGAEATGLTPDWTAPDITAIHLPMLGIADSLNVSATAAVLFFEALRQRA